MRFSRSDLLNRARDHTGAWDMVVVGGGATGAGVAVDAAARGYDVLLLEQNDFGKATSSRSTKLIHGGVRYLRQGNLSLVRESLRERALLRQNAPHLVWDLPFVIPAYRWWEKRWYQCGMKLYDALAGASRPTRSRALSAGTTFDYLPALRTKGLRGGVVYHDAGFDDARLVVNLVQTAVEHDAVCLNYVRVRELIKEQSKVVGVVAEDVETGDELRVSASVVINATGPFVDELRRRDDARTEPLVSPSQGIHIVLAAARHPGRAAMLVPRTSDGRVLFSIPWGGRVVVGTTDTPVEQPTLEPRPLDNEIDFLLETAGRYLASPPGRSDVLSVFAGIRPLVRSRETRATWRLSRDHTVEASASGLLTVAGGKWTTYRKMAQDTVDRAAQLAQLPARPCSTAGLAIHGAEGHELDGASNLKVYGGDAAAVADLIDSGAALREPIHPLLPYVAGQVVWAARCEMARTVDDVLARRTRALVVHANAAMEAAPTVAALMAAELGRDETWQQQQVDQFRAMAAGYLPRRDGP